MAHAREFLQTSKLIEWLVAHPVIGLIGVLAIAAAYACSEIAMTKNRNDRLWATLGLLFSVLPLIVLLALPAIGPSESADGAVWKGRLYGLQTLNGRAKVPPAG